MKTFVNCTLACSDGVAEPSFVSDSDESCNGGHQKNTTMMSLRFEN